MNSNSKAGIQPSLISTVESPELSEAFFLNVGYQHLMHDKESDIWAGLWQLITTTAIVFDLDDRSFSERYCFRNPEKARQELVSWHKRGFDDQRPTGWVACRGVSACDLKESMQAHYGANYGSDVSCILLDSPFEERLRLTNDPQRISSLIDKPIDYVEHIIGYLASIGEL